MIYSSMDSTRYYILNLYRDVLKDEETTMYWIQCKHLLASLMLCLECASGCRSVPHKESFYGDILGKDVKQ